MLVLQNMTIKHKLISIIMATCIVALLLAAIVLILWEWSTLRHTMARSLSTQAEMIADNCKASLTFNDPDDTKATLSALHVESSIIFGGVYNKKGELFAGYYRSDVGRKVQPSEIQKSGYTFGEGFLTVFKTIILDGEIIGTVCVRSDLRPMYAMLIRNIRIISVVLLLASLTAYAVSSKLQNIISAPILSLAESATRIGKGHFDHRVEVHSKDELGYLAQSFNNMAEDLQTTTTSIDNLNREILQRNQAEQKQAELLKKVESANKELTDFAYVVSHDLKAPLRGIKTLASWISTDYADKLDQNGKEQMNLLLSRVDRMHNLIDGILQYSRIGRVEEKKVQVNLNELVAEVVDMVAPPQNIAITVENELPVIEFERTRIMQVFQNLLSNAIKFMDKLEGHVRIGCVEEDGFWKFTVADNGPGIEEKYFEKIFEMFQTLAPRDDVESTGVGLTVAKKIVELYGGRIWLQSKVGEGSTFLFTLPKQETEVKDAQLQASIVG